MSQLTIESEVKQGWSEAQLRQALAQLGYAHAKNSDCKTFPAHFKTSLDKLKTQQNQTEGKAISSALSAPPTDDDVLAVAEQANIELDVVMQAAQNCQTLSFLVKWAEEYQAQKSAIEQEEAELAIRESVTRRIELEKLTQKEKELQERLVSALAPSTSTIPSVSSIEKMLGVEIPEPVRNLAASDYTAEKAPDFLLQARSLLKLSTK
jgi:flagellar hook-basal body complex protein FliE